MATPVATLDHPLLNGAQQNPTTSGTSAAKFTIGSLATFSSHNLLILGFFVTAK
ncbi:hypothetical protein A2U01_0071565, partial [Trifolium medium]|nr:hypothetical protein [Trifolium medium]